MRKVKNHDQRDNTRKETDKRVHQLQVTVICSIWERNIERWEYEYAEGFMPIYQMGLFVSLIEMAIQEKGQEFHPAPLTLSYQTLPYQILSLLLFMCR